MTPGFCDGHELAVAYGITAESLRLYEARGLLRPTVIDGIAYYTPRDRARIEIVLKGRRLGFSLDEIEKLVFRPTSPAVAKPAAANPGALDRTLDHLRDLFSERGSLDASIEELRSLLRRR